MNIKVIDNVQCGFYDAIVICVGHFEFKKMSVNDYKKFGKKKHVLFDLKHVLPSHLSDISL